jgi:hypothetical protein
MSDLDTTSLKRAIVGAADDEIVLLEARTREAQLNGDISVLGELTLSKSMNAIMHPRQ